MSSKDNKLVEQASTALKEYSEGSFGKFLSQTEQDKGVIEVRFESTAKGYSGWHWVVTLTQPDKRKAATLSEINLLAGEGALLAPEWVPWSERLREFRNQLREEGKAKTQRWRCGATKEDPRPQATGKTRAGPTEQRPRHRFQ